MAKEKRATDETITSPSTTSYLTANSPLIGEILTVFKEKGDAAEFARQLYLRTPKDDIAVFSPSELAAIARSSFNFLKSRTPNTPSLRVYNPSVKEHGWTGPYTVIEVINDDMPFLVDSCTEALTRHRLQIQCILHPVLRVSRNVKGALETIYPAAESTNGTGASPKGSAESVIHFRVAAIHDPVFLEEVSADIRHTLSTIRQAVEDWKAMLAQAESMLKETESALPALKKHYTPESPVSAENYLAETQDFIRWLCDKNFIFLGYAQYDFVETGKGLDIKSSHELGILKDESQKSVQLVPKEVQHFLRNPNFVEITKSNRSVIHRPIHMDDISIKRFDASGNVIGEHRFRGLFTSIVYYQSADHIPMIRQKMASVLNRAGFPKGGYSGKELASALESFPRDELFQISEDELFETCMGIVSLAVQRRVRLFARKDKFERFISCILFIPRERFSTGLRKKIQIVLEQAFNGDVVNYYTQVTDSPFARLNLIVKTEPGAIPAYDITDVEAKLAEVARIWADTLKDEIAQKADEGQREKLFETYAEAFSAAYCERFTAYHAYWDIKSMERMYAQGGILFDLYETNDNDKDWLQLKIYSCEKQLRLSDIMPILENMGFPIIDEHTYKVAPKGKQAVWVHHFRLTPPDGQIRPKIQDIKDNFESLLSKVWEREVQNDGFNQLILCAGLAWRQVVLVRAYAKYLRQIGFTYSQTSIEQTLSRHPGITRKLVALFDARFDPSNKQDRVSVMETLQQEIEAALASVSDVTDDRIIRRYMDLILATLRTNYFQSGDNENVHKAYISFKFDSALVPGLPLPRPYAEIFVYSSRVEGIHLRGGKVARGGLRWSDRAEDFRTEVLGLMKAQMTKNAVIVPVGSKGGFVVKQPPQEGGREAYLQEGIACYKTFLSGLLDITDNIINGAVVPPKQVVRHDADDPYLVVAADKGTASFSDIANSVSAAYGFWLGDAFASGGSAGYDHKKMAITARGGWVSVQRHFKEMGINTQTTDFTVTGIGDMAGDVFGNGMLLSRHIRLVAAFNHIHIFLDPNPDAAKSFDERKRLFNLPRSTWKDYNASLISQGGGIFERSAKSIPLTAEVKARLDIEEDALTPDELIRAILKAPVDLLWNGGIGTYIKSADEGHADVGDKANDNLRINGHELRCKAVGEGGNLGVTQKGRIEYALKGGRINTDFIDNSAGVDCSDHEVNIKIALGGLVQSKKLTQAARNTLLEEMTDEVARLVLRDNELQAQALTVAELQGHSQLEQQERLMTRLESKKLLNRKIEFLPDSHVIARRKAEKSGLTRPELAILLSYSKQSIYTDLLPSNLGDESYFMEDLLIYFPTQMRERFPEALTSHPLRREIIASHVTNSIVNRAGITFFHSLMEDTGMKGCDVARAYAITRDAFGLRTLWDDIEALDETVPVAIGVELFLEIQKLIERNAMWFLRNHSQPLQVAKLVDVYAAGVKTLSSALETLLSPIAMKHYRARFTRYHEAGVPETLARQIAGLGVLASACDIVKVAQNGALPVDAVGKIYFELGGRLSLGLLRSYIAEQPAEGYWDRLSLRMLTEDMYDQQMRLTAEVIKHNCNDVFCLTAVANWCEANNKEISRYDQFVNDLKSSEHIDSAMLVVAAKRVEAICAVSQRNAE